jgi:hypothetical protein
VLFDVGLNTDSTTSESGDIINELFDSDAYQALLVERDLAFENFEMLAGEDMPLPT